MTENEAKTKWCPMVRHVNAQFEDCGNSLPFSGRQLSGFSNCVGSACMMWRVNHVIVEPAGKTIYADNAGFCGLAGMP